MSYIYFLLKSLFKNKINLLFLVSIPVISCLFLFLNNNSQKQDTIKYYADRDFKFNKDQISFMNSHKKEFNSNELESIENYAYMKNHEYSLLENIKNKEWNEAYLNQIKLNDYMNVEGNPSWETDHLIRNNLLMEYLNKNNIKNPESENYPTHNLTFTLWVDNFIVPITLYLVIIFTISNLVNDNYFDKIAKNRLLVFNLYKQFLISFFVIFCLFFIYYLLINIFNFSFTSLIIGKINFNYPYYVHIGNKMSYVPIINIYPKTIALQFMSILFVVSSVFNISNFSKKKITTAFFCIILIIIPSIIVHLKNISFSKYIPHTYLDTVGIASGNSYKFLNRVSTTFGIKVLFIFTLLNLTLIFVNIFLSRRGDNI